MAQLSLTLLRYELVSLSMHSLIDLVILRPIFGISGTKGWLLYGSWGYSIPLADGVGAIPFHLHAIRCLYRAPLH
jgi:hypothetical protein